MEYLILFTFNIQQLSSVAYRLNPHSHAYYSNVIWNKSLQKEKKKWLVQGRGATWTVFKGTSPEDTAATTLITRAATFTVSWNWMNFWMFAYTERPHLTTYIEYTMEFWRKYQNLEGKDKNTKRIFDHHITLRNICTHHTRWHKLA